jgi:ABC-type antimicrobial peptide transport system permease subunit
LNEWVYSSIVVNVDDADNVESVTKDIQDMGFHAESNKELLQSAQNSLQIVELVLGGIGMVAFLVAAIGIANTMMMSTYERTKEIGIMKVLGCDMRDIQKLFLAEAGFIGFLGGVVGVGLTYGISVVINYVVRSMMESSMSGNISVIPWWLAAAAIAFSTVMGMIAGYFPARRAMKLSPLAAIRTE